MAKVTDTTSDVIVMRPESKLDRRSRALLMSPR
jgi:hypothetical protein